MAERVKGERPFAPTSVMSDNIRAFCNTSLRNNTYIRVFFIDIPLCGIYVDIFPDPE